jgi:hypothetical protein
MTWSRRNRGSNRDGVCNPLVGKGLVARVTGYFLTTSRVVDGALGFRAHIEEQIWIWSVEIGLRVCGKMPYLGWFI